MTLTKRQRRALVPAEMPETLETLETPETLAGAAGEALEAPAASALAASALAAAVAPAAMSAQERVLVECAQEWLVAHQQVRDPHLHEDTRRAYHQTVQHVQAWLLRFGTPQALARAYIEQRDAEMYRDITRRHQSGCVYRLDAERAVRASYWLRYQTLILAGA